MIASTIIHSTYYSKDETSLTTWLRIKIACHVAGLCVRKSRKAKFWLKCTQNEYCLGQSSKYNYPMKGHFGKRVN